MKVIKLDRVNSTNTWVAENARQLSNPSLVWCEEQTAGRGQRGNYWESTPGLNITASLFLKLHNFPAHKQFLISEWFSLLIIEFLRKHEIEAKVKWPNDIYVGDKKICGILAEHIVLGSNLDQTILGFGINVNQTVFFSDAPNPVSMSQLTGKKYDIENLIQSLAYDLESGINYLQTPDPVATHFDFIMSMWRNNGEWYRFNDLKAGEEIIAGVDGVNYDGTLILKTPDNQRRSYAFKEVEFIL